MYEKLKNFNEFIEATKKLVNSNPTRFFAPTNTAFTKRFPTLYKDIQYWYKLIMLKDININNCSKFVDAFFELNNLNLNQVMDKLQLNHKLKDGSWRAKDGRFYSNKNPKLTNEICQEIFDRYGEDAFIHFDPDWKEKKVKEKLTKENLEDHFDVIPEKIQEEIEKETEAVEKHIIDEEKKLELKDTLEAKTIRELYAIEKSVKQVVDYKSENRKKDSIINELIKHSNETEKWL
jgi:hypothetical protein